MTDAQEITGHRDPWLIRAADRITRPGRFTGTPSRRHAPLTASQHILHLLLSIVTGGLWLPVWIIRAWRGNPLPPETSG